VSVAAGSAELPHPGSDARPSVPCRDGWHGSGERGSLGCIDLAASLFWLARPKLAPWVAAIPLYAYGYAHWEAGLAAGRMGALWLVLAAWICLSVGTMWLNAGLDQTDAAAVFARPTPVPGGIRWFGAGALAVSVALAWAADPGSGLCAASAAVLSVLYSHPRTAFKGHPHLGPLVNAIGYGLLSPIAGWALSGARPTPRSYVTLGLWALWMLGAYFAAQVFQAEQDAARGYRTLVVTHGPVRTLRVARGCMNMAIAWAAILTAGGLYPRLTLLAYPLFFWADAHARRWQAAPDGAGAARAEQLLRRMLTGGMALAALAYLDYWLA
jgi:4-hydroxybenzoate polyprenyltransferase